MIWTKDKAKKFLNDISESLPPDVKSATNFILSELDKAEKNSTNGNNVEKFNCNPRVEIIDENHQSFNGEIYTKRKKMGIITLQKFYTQKFTNFTADLM